MTEKNQPEHQEQKQLTPEQIKEMRQKMHEYHKEQMPFLKIQSEYEKHLADIAESRARRVEMELRLGHMLAPPQEEKPEKQERKLKQD